MKDLFKAILIGSVLMAAIGATAMLSFLFLPVLIIGAIYCVLLMVKLDREEMEDHEDRE